MAAMRTARSPSVVGMRFFGRRQQQKQQPAVPPLDGLVDRLVLPCATIRLAGHAPASAGSSYVAGHPYLPEERPWPEWDGQPMFFLAQVDFAEVPPLPGFPERGLLQWFVGSDDTYGLTFDETQGTAGFETRWYADTDAPSLRRPADATPWHVARDAGEEVYCPIDVVDATALTFAPGRVLPAYDELPAGLDLAPVAQLAASVGEAPEDVPFVWDEYVRGASSTVPGLASGSTVGGSADFAQSDPRGEGAFPAHHAPGGRLVLQLDAAQVGGWGDVGVAHLFGDPAAVARGDLSSLRYHWDCS